MCRKHFENEKMQGDYIIPWSKGGKTVDVYSLGKFSLIDKKVFWIYNIYGIVMDTIKMQKRNKEKSL